MLTKEQIRDRLKIYQVELTDTAVDLFPEATPDNKMRHVVGIWILGDGYSRTVDINKTEEDARKIFEEIPVPPADQVPVPEGWHFDIENPFLVLESGANLQGQVITSPEDAPDPSLEATIIYWDTPEI